MSNSNRNRLNRLQMAHVFWSHFLKTLSNQIWLEGKRQPQLLIKSLCNWEAHLFHTWATALCARNSFQINLGDSSPFRIHWRGIICSLTLGWSLLVWYLFHTDNDSEKKRSMICQDSLRVFFVCVALSLSLFKSLRFVPSFTPQTMSKF